MNRTPKQNPVGRTGATAVELAICFPIILVFFIGMVGVTQAFTLRDTAQHAAYEGARRGILLNSKASDCDDAVQEFVRRIRIRGAVTTVSPQTISNAVQEITVGVTIPMNENAWVAAPFFPKSWNLYAEVKLTRETE
jgi:Flp pilus assembly protein TadG